jgi:hypothetical protein
MNHLKSFPAVRRGNYQFKVSVFKNSNVLIIGNHLTDDRKFIIQHFHNEIDAVIFMEYLVEKDIYG